MNWTNNFVIARNLAAPGQTQVLVTLWHNKVMVWWPGLSCTTLCTGLHSSVVTTTDTLTAPLPLLGTEKGKLPADGEKGPDEAGSSKCCLCLLVYITLAACWWYAGHAGCPRKNGVSIFLLYSLEKTSQSQSRTPSMQTEKRFSSCINTPNQSIIWNIYEYRFYVVYVPY